MATQNVTTITPPRVPLTDSRTGLISREWYRFFLNLFVVTGSGQNNTSITDLQLGPLASSQDDIAKIITEIESLKTQPTDILNWLLPIQDELQALASAPVPSAQIPWSSVLNQPRIEVYDTTASIALTSTPTLLIPASVAPGNRGIVYDASTGVFTFSATGSYSLSLSVNAVSSAANQFVYIYAENDTGAGWTVNANSGKTYELTNSNMVQIVYSQAVGRVAGQKVRYWIYSNDGKITLQTYTLPGGVGAIVPAIRIQYS